MRERLKGAWTRMRSRSWRRRLAAAVCALALCAVTGYLTFVYSGVPFIADMRRLYIETAMGTMSHQWLATAFIPERIISDVMADVEAQFESNMTEASEPPPAKVKGTITKPIGAMLFTLDIEEELPSAEEVAWEEFFDLFPELDPATLEGKLDWTELGNLRTADLDGVLTRAGDEAYCIDVPNRLLILTVTGSGYQGKLAIVKGSDRVVLGVNRSSWRGQTVTEICGEYGAVLGVNAGGFFDPEGHGSGKDGVGLMRSQGETYHRKAGGHFQIAGYDYEDNFLVGYGLDADGLRDAVEFYPILVLNGENCTDGSFGMGIQPRTVIGQTVQGDTLMLVVDGRRAGHSLGTTVSECADILLRYDCWTAMNMDGGSSSSMTYDGRMITRTSSPATNGRTLPNAWVVLPPAGADAGAEGEAQDP